jgi:Spy/CpxP family protein refolding chaperone
MSKLNLIAIVAIVATVTLVAGFAAPIFAQSNSTGGGNMHMNMTGGNTTGMNGGNMTMHLTNSSSGK